MEAIYAKVNNVCLVILTTIALTGALVYTKVALLPLMIAIFIYFATLPAVQYFQTKLRLSRLVSVILVAGIFLLSATVLFFLVTGSFQRFLVSAHLYQDRLLALFYSTLSFLDEKGFSLGDFSIIQHIEKLPLFSMAQSLAGGVTSFLGNALLVIVFVLFLIAGQGTGAVQNHFIAEIQFKISRYVATKFLLSLVTGILLWILLFSVGVELAFMLAVLAFLLNFIPNIGSIIATLLPIPIILLQFGMGWELWLVLIVSTLIQFIIGNILETKIMGENLGLHPVVILVFLIFWGLVWGIPGMFLAVPITAVLKIVFSRIEATKPIAELLGGKLSW